jgi:hypothetical protein
MPHPDDPRTPTAPGAPAAQPPGMEPASEIVERRCWRCLKMFPGDGPAGPSPTADFWLCDPCDATLIPQRTGRR